MLDKLKLPLAFAFMGFLFSERKFILFLDKLTPIQGLVVYYTIVTITVLILEYFGLVIAGYEFMSIGHTIGTILILFSYFILVNWESCYINLVTQGKCDTKSEVSQVLFQSEDGATFFFWSKFTNNLKLLRFLTYMLTPFVLTFIGSLLITEKIELGIM